MAVLRNLPLSDLVPNHRNPRKQCNNIESLAQTIEAKGLLQPITVRQWGNAYQIIMGNRRYLACQSLGWTEMPCIIIESTPEDNDWYMLIENIQRDDLTDSEKGKSVEQLRQSVAPDELSNREVGRRLGVNEIQVRLWLHAAGYPEEVQQMTKDSEVSDYQLRPIVELQTPQEQIKAAEHIRDNDLGYREAKATVEIIKDMPQPIRSKLTEEPLFTVRDAIKETVYTAEVISVEDAGCFHEGEVTYESLKPQIQKCKGMLQEEYIGKMRAIDKMKLKGEFQVFKAQLELILAQIDYM